MKGLIIKDFINLRNQVKIIAVIMIVYVLMAVSSHQSDLLTMMLLLFCILLPVSTFSYDEVCQWERYALTMPISRRDVVLSKYVMSWLVLAVFLVLSVVIQLFFHESMEQLRLNLAGQAGVALLFTALVLPLLFRFGSEKGRMLLILTLGIPFLFVMAWTKLVHGQLPSAETMLAWLPIIGLVASVISVWLSLKIYQGKKIG